MKRIFLIVLLSVLLPVNYLTPFHGNRTKRQNKNCPPGSRLCGSGECFAEVDACDGIKNCRDGSDETRQICREYEIECQNYLFTCEYGGCIEKNKVCNRVDDCIDGTDEKNCNYTVTQIRPQIGSQTSYQTNTSTSNQDACKEDPYKFRCKNNACIDSNLICDGVPNCSDGSDESRETCGTFVCPSFLFQCDYGGCIEKRGVNNGVRDCIDGSDEKLGVTTTSTTTLPPAVSCRRDEFRCKNNQCINSALICNSEKDCSDGSDETANLCRGRFCPADKFTCDYGGCTSGLKCNGISDCIDGSDEAPKLCGQPTKGTTQNPPVSVPVNLFPPTQISPVGSCLRPPNPPNGVIYIGNCQTCSSPIVDNNGALLLKCNPGYIPTDEYIAFCSESILSTSLTCKKATCEPVKSISAKYVCFHNGVSDSKFCEPENLIIGTQVNYKCRYGYESLDQPISKQDSVCQMKNNVPTWVPSLFECVPQCGIKPSKGVGGFIAGGNNASLIEYPWHCGVFKKIDGVFQQICGGTLIDRDYVISAAHCFNQPDHPELYRIIFAKYSRSYGIVDQYQKEYQIKKIINNPYFSLDVYESDISFIVLNKEVQFSSYVMPACVDLNHKHYNYLLSPGSVGQVAGWGLNSNNNPSEVLQSTNLQYRTYQECREKATDEFKKFLSGRKFCAGYLNGTAVCQGDSGGGLMFQAKEGPPLWYLMGIVSVGVKNAHNVCIRTQYTVFTSIRDELEWIKGQYKENRNFN